MIVACDDGAMLYRCMSEPAIGDLPVESVPTAAEATLELSMFKASEFERGGPLIVSGIPQQMRRAHSSDRGC